MPLYPSAMVSGLLLQFLGIGMVMPVPKSLSTKIFEIIGLIVMLLYPSAVVSGLLLQFLEIGMVMPIPKSLGT